MEIFKEISAQETCYVFDVIIENGVLLHVRPDGSADGVDGNRYYVVSDLVDDEVVVKGWCKDIDKPLHLEEEQLK